METDEYRFREEAKREIDKTLHEINDLCIKPFLIFSAISFVLFTSLLFCIQNLLNENRWIALGIVILFATNMFIGTHYIHKNVSKKYFENKYKETQEL